MVWAENALPPRSGLQAIHLAVPGCPDVGIFLPQPDVASHGAPNHREPIALPEFGHPEMILNNHILPAAPTRTIIPTAIATP
jgi:hypothetical protein